MPELARPAVTNLVKEMTVAPWWEWLLVGFMLGALGVGLTWYAVAGKRTDRREAAEYRRQWKAEDDARDYAEEFKVPPAVT